jgi:hypothetical protein
MKEDLNIEREQSAFYEKLAKRTVSILNKRGFDAHYVPNKKAALSQLLKMIPEGNTVGTADSITLLQVGILSELKKRGSNEIFNPFLRHDDGRLVVEGEKRDEIMRKVFQCDVYLIGTNAITLDGKLVNIDGYGNRIAAMIFGPKKVVVVAGTNKIVKDADEAIARIKEYCAPVNALRHGIKHCRPEFLELPCVDKGFCVNCNHPWRICRYTSIIEGVIESRQGYLSVILVGENLGM